MQLYATFGGRSHLHVPTAMELYQTKNIESLEYD